MRIFIEPNEPLLFRTGRPFVAGENNFAETNFPPTPETIQGALRAMIAVQWGRGQCVTRTIGELFQEPELVSLIGKRTGNNNVYGRFRITGLTLGRRDPKTAQVSRLFPVPAHLIQATVRDGNLKKQIPVRLHPRTLSSEESNHPQEMQLPFPALGEGETAVKSEPFEGWLTPRGLQCALSGTGFPEQEDIVPASQVYQLETRPGISINNATRTTEERYLYQIQMIRLQSHYGFVVDIELGLAEYGASELPHPEERTARLEMPAELAFLKKGGWMTIGGEQRAAYFTVLTPQEIVPEQHSGQTRTGNLLYFATPACFKHGWLPGSRAIFPAIPISAVINRYQSIGGWFLNPGDAGGASKLTRRCVPAGSVYYFGTRIQEPQQPLTEYGWQIGYGIAYTGEYGA